MAELEAQGFTALEPRYRERPRDGELWGRLRPALPGFVIVEFDAAIQPWKRICSTLHVVELLGADPERPTPIRAEEAEWLLRQFGPDGEQRWHETQRVAVAAIAAGTTVRIRAGHLEGRHGVLVWSDGRSAEVEMAGRRVTLAQALLVAGAA